MGSGCSAQQNCEVQPINTQQKNNQTGDDFLKGIEQNNKENVEKRKSSKYLGTQKKEKYVRKSIKDKELLRENFQTVKKEIKEYEDQNTKNEDKENQGLDNNNKQKSNVVIEQVEEGEESNKLGAVRLSKKFRPQRLV